MPENLPSVADLRQGLEALEEPISPFLANYYKAQEGEITPLGVYNLGPVIYCNLFIVDRDIYFTRERDQIFRIDRFGHQTLFYKTNKSEECFFYPYPYGLFFSHRTVYQNESCIALYLLDKNKKETHCGFVQGVSICRGNKELYVQNKGKFFRIGADGVMRPVFRSGNRANIWQSLWYGEVWDGFCWGDWGGNIYFWRNGKIKQLGKHEHTERLKFASNGIYFQREEAIYALLSPNSSKEVVKATFPKGDFPKKWYAGPKGIYICKPIDHSDEQYEISFIAVKGQYSR